MDVREGDILKIKGERYIVLEAHNEADYYDDYHMGFKGKHKDIELKKEGLESEHPTHHFKIYEEQNHGLLIPLQWKTPEWLGKSKKELAVIEHGKPEDVLLVEVKLIKKVKK